MPSLLSHRRAAAGTTTADRPRRRDGTVLLATLESAPFDAGGAALAIDVAHEHGASLVVVNVVACAAAGRGMGPDLGDPPRVAAALRQVVARASAAGVRVRVLRVRTPRPVRALVEVCEDACPSLVVFAPDLVRARRRPSRRLFHQALRALEARTPWLLWAPDPVRAPAWERALAAVVRTATTWPSTRPRPL